MRPSLAATRLTPTGAGMRKDPEKENGGVSKVKIALGAASLFFFLVGLKRSFRTEEGTEISQPDGDWDEPMPRRESA